MEILTGQGGQFVGVLTNGRHSDGTGPIVIHVRLLECVQLQPIGTKSGFVFENVVRRWGHRTLPDALGNQVEIVPVRRN